MASPDLKWLDLARIDIKNQGEGNDVKVNVVEGAGCNITNPGWFANEGVGYVLETYDKRLVLELECHGAGTLMVRLMGVDRRSSSGEVLPLLVDYTRLAVNKDIIFWEIKPLWHNDAYSYKKQVSDGEKVKVEISLSYHNYKGHELAELISMWNGLKNS